jgi:hypothetical protein
VKSLFGKKGERDVLVETKEDATNSKRQLGAQKNPQMRTFKQIYFLREVVSTSGFEV